LRLRSNAPFLLAGAKIQARFRTALPDSGELRESRPIGPGSRAGGAGERPAGKMAPGAGVTAEAATWVGNSLALGECETARASGAISLLGGRPIIAIYCQRMRGEPQFPSSGHWINSHL
jgi:hypothetical protein